MVPKTPTLTQRMEDVERALGLSAEDPSEKWYRNPLATLAILALAVAVFGVFVAYFAWWQPQWKAEEQNQLTQKIDEEIEGELKKRNLDQMASDISSMKGQLSEISGFVKIIAASQMQHSASLAPSEFEKSLPTLQAALSAAKSTGATSPPQVVKDIQQKLIQSSHDQPDFWGAASAFINYRYQSAPRALPNCFASRPATQLAADITATQTTIPVTLAYADCEVDLNSREPLSHPEWFRWPTALKCDRCEVTYNGKEIPLFGTGVRALTLKNCIFEFQATPNSPTNGKNLIATILASKDQQSIQYSTSGDS